MNLEPLTVEQAMAADIVWYASPASKTGIYGTGIGISKRLIAERRAAYTQEGAIAEAIRRGYIEAPKPPKWRFYEGGPEFDAPLLEAPEDGALVWVAGGDGYVEQWCWNSGWSNYLDAGRIFDSDQSAKDFLIADKDRHARMVANGGRLP